MPSQSEIDYVIWQNRAFRFYLGARLLQRFGLSAPAAYAATQSLELLLKATLVYWDRSFEPVAAGHAIAKLVRTLRNKAPGAKGFDVPNHFFHEQRYHNVSRYPSGSRGLLIPASFIADLDAAFANLVALVPFQHNTELKRALAGRDAKALTVLRLRNNEIRRIRKVLGVQAPKRTTDFVSRGSN
jgi:HEPN domain-containing protein